MASLERVMQQLHDSEINAGVETFYDAGMRVWLGDTINGIRAETSIKRTGHQWPAGVTAARWLHAVALRLYPESNYAKASGRRRGHAEAITDFAIIPDGLASTSSAWQTVERVDVRPDSS
jgi:hypothetical protein